MRTRMSPLPEKTPKLPDSWALICIVGPPKMNVGQGDVGDAVDFPGARLAVVGRMTK